MKPIKLTQKQIEQAKKDFLSRFETMRFQGTKLNLSYDFTEIFQKEQEKEIKKPIVYMHGNTYLKMLSYVTKCSDEIAWHGTVIRGTKEKDNHHHFFIKDVFLYPQEITGATVRTDRTTEEGMPLYNKWCSELSDETFNTMRFHGHSHVNMSVNPSETDKSNWDEFLQDLPEDDFYVFLIMNKKQEIHIEVYDLAQNTVFEKEDITFQVYLDQNYLLNQVDKEIDENIQKKDYKYQYTRAGFYDYAYNYPYGSEKKTNKKHCVILNRKGRDFAKENLEYEGMKADLRKNGKIHKVFIPYEDFTYTDIRKHRQEGWHVQEFEIPKEYGI